MVPLSTGIVSLKLSPGRYRRVRALMDGESVALKALEGSSPSSPTNFSKAPAV